MKTKKTRLLSAGQSREYRTSTLVLTMVSSVLLWTMTSCGPRSVEEEWVLGACYESCTFQKGAVFPGCKPDGRFWFVSGGDTFTFSEFPDERVHWDFAEPPYTVTLRFDLSAVTTSTQEHTYNLVRSRQEVDSGHASQIGFYKGDVRVRSAWIVFDHICEDLVPE